MSRLVLEIGPGDMIRLINALQAHADLVKRSLGVDAAGPVRDLQQRVAEARVTLTDGEVMTLSSNPAANISRVISLAEVRGEAVNVGQTDEGGTRWLVRDENERGEHIAVSISVEDPYEDDEDTLVEHGWDAEDPAGVEYPDNAYDAGREDDYGKHGGPLS